LTLKIGVDLGGTKTEIIALNDVGDVLLQRRVSTPQNDYHATLRTVADLVTSAETELGKTGTVGIGLPGSLSPATGFMRNANSICLNDKPLGEDINALLQRTVRVTNDANCFALSEAVDGAAADANSVFGVIIGTGTGAGIIIDKSIHDGPNGIAGEWGHNPLPWPSPDEIPGRQCWCGLSGCIETWLSGPALELNWYEQMGDKLSVAEIDERASSGDADAEKILQQYEHRMARGLAHIINVLDPEVIVLGGGLSNLKRLYKNVPLIWGEFIFSDIVRTKLLPPKYGDSSGVRGAAWLGAEQV